jgi:tryptophanyl-tRNA synthetase
MKRILTGVKPTGIPHIGNYLGAIKPAITMSHTDRTESFLFIADYHALTTVRDPKIMKEDVHNVAATWLALGLDPAKTVFYRQSAIPEIFELTWILTCFCSKGEMNRAHAYKALTQANIDGGKDDPDQNIGMGIYTYPILMAADILLFNSDIVPVGADQVQHIEIARDLAQRFNHYYGDVLKIPEASVQKDGAAVVGLDGRKMSKSYGNSIELWLPEKKLKKTINKITTNSQAPEESKIFEGTIVDLYNYFATEQEITDLRSWYAKGIGWGEAKAELFKVVNRELEGPREKYHELMTNTSKIDEILAEGAKRASITAKQVLATVRQACGI